MTEDPQANADFTVDRSNLYREETFSDLKVGTIKRLTPVRPDGNEDKSRKVVFVGQSSLMTPHGPVPTPQQVARSATAARRRACTT